MSANVPEPPDHTVMSLLALPVTWTISKMDVRGTDAILLNLSQPNQMISALFDEESAIELANAILAQANKLTIHRAI